MEITLSDGTIINVLLINIERNYIDWRRVGGDGYQGVCRTDVELTDYASAEAEMTAALDSAAIPFAAV